MTIIQRIMSILSVLISSISKLGRNHVLPMDMWKVRSLIGHTHFTRQQNWLHEGNEKGRGGKRIPPSPDLYRGPEIGISMIFLNRWKDQTKLMTMHTFCQFPPYSFNDVFDAVYGYDKLPAPSAIGSSLIYWWCLFTLFPIKKINRLN